MLEKVHSSTQTHVFSISSASWELPPVPRLLPLLHKGEGSGRRSAAAAAGRGQSVGCGDQSKSLTERFASSPPGRLAGSSPQCRQMPPTGGTPRLTWCKDPRGAASPAPGVGWQMLHHPPVRAERGAGAVTSGAAQGMGWCHVPGSLPSQ